MGGARRDRWGRTRSGDVREMVRIRVRARRRVSRGTPGGIREARVVKIVFVDSKGRGVECGERRNLPVARIMLSAMKGCSINVSTWAVGKAAVCGGN